MNKLKLNKKQREMFAEKLLDLAHLIFGGMVIGQIAVGQSFSITYATFGLVCAGYLYWVSYKFTQKLRNEVVNNES